MTPANLPSRRERRKRLDFKPYIRCLLGAIMAALFIWLIGKVWNSDIYAYDRRLIPLITLVICGAYAALGLWVISRLFKRISYYYNEAFPPQNEAATIEAPIYNTRVAPVMLIDKPRLQKHLVRGFEFIVSTGVWVLFLYFSQYLFTALVWWFGGRYVSGFIFSLSAIEGTLTAIFYTLIYASVVFIVLFGWANWNYWRYGRLERRKPRPPVQDSAVAVYYNVPLSTVYMARMAKVAYFMPTEDGISLAVKEKLPIQREDVIERRSE